eukprot:474371-Amorphochlora_amoeboformis.AAC.2
MSTKRFDGQVPSSAPSLPPPLSHVAVVTGAARGIGKVVEGSDGRGFVFNSSGYALPYLLGGIAERLGSEGASVVILDVMDGTKTVE